MLAECAAKLPDCIANRRRFWFSSVLQKKEHIHAGAVRGSIFKRVVGDGLLQYYVVESEGNR